MTEEQKNEAPEQQEQKQDSRPDMVKIEAKAIIDWLDAEGKVISTETYWRGVAPIVEHLSELLDTEAKKESDRLSIYLKPVNDERERIVIAEGTVIEVLEKLARRLIHPAHGIGQLQLVVSQLAEFSALKGIIVTAVFEDAMPVGFGFTSESSEVTEADIQVLVSSATGQLDMFKDAMRKKMSIQFEDDKGQIIIPGKGGVPNLKLVR